MTRSSPAPRLETTVLAVARNVRRAFDHALAEADLNLSSASALSYLDDLGPMSQTRLAALLHIGRASAGSVVDELERRAFVRREADPADRRAWLVVLTNDGRSKAGEFARIDAKLRAEFRRGFSQADRLHLADLLVRLDANATRVVAPPFERP